MTPSLISLQVAVTQNKQALVDADGTPDAAGTP